MVYVVVVKHTVFVMCHFCVPHMPTGRFIGSGQ